METKKYNQQKIKNSFIKKALNLNSIKIHPELSESRNFLNGNENISNDTSLYFVKKAGYHHIINKESNDSTIMKNHDELNEEMLIL